MLIAQRPRDLAHACVPGDILTVGSMGLSERWDDLKWRLWGERKALKVLRQPGESQAGLGSMGLGWEPDLGDVDPQQLGRWVSEGDVEGLRREFSQAVDWNTRETIMVAFRNLWADHRAEAAIREQLRSALGDVLALCRAESSGGSYRENCLNTAEELLNELDKPEG